MVEHPACHSQGELLYYIGKNNIKEVFVDKDLPGNLSHNAFIQVIKTKYPDVKISVIEPYIETESKLISVTTTRPGNNPLKIALLVAIIQTLFSIAIQYNTLTPRNLVYAIIAGVTTLIFFYGGYKWLNLSQSQS